MPANAKSNPNGEHLDEAKATLQDAKAMLDDGIADARDAVGEIAEDLQTEVRRVTERTNSFVKENPGVALLGAMGVGILVGLAIRSRN